MWKGKKSLEYSAQDAYVRVMAKALGEEEEVFLNLWLVKAGPTFQICAWK